MSPELRAPKRRFARWVNGSFLALTLALALVLASYWSFLLEPRLREEAGANAIVLAQAQDRLLADILAAEKVESRDVSNALDELLLFTDPATKSPYFLGVSLEVDYDAVDAVVGSLDLSRGERACAHCFTALVEVYSKQDFELLGVASFLVSDAFFERLRNDVRNKIIAEAALVLLLIALAWFFVARLVKRLDEQIEVQQRTQEELQQAKDEAETSQAEAETSQAEAEAARSAAQAANRAKSAFLANMSHEIRTPLNAILGYAQILGGDEGLDEKQRKAVGTIDSSGQHLLGLINDVLDLSKIEAGREELHRADFDLEVMLQGLESMFAMRCAQKGLTWRFEEDVAGVAVRADQGKLRQVLINLLGNAVKFTSEGEVGLVVQRLEANRYSFAVADTGPGIPEEKQAFIFQPFQQEQEGIDQGGTGLGLAISNRYIELMGGQIEVASQPQGGAVFSFVLDLPPADAPIAALESLGNWSHVRHIKPGQSIYALVVDDVQTNRDVLSLMLKEIGVEVEDAENGAVALERVRERIPDIVLLDILMPVMDGPTTIKELFAEFGAQATKVVAVSASVFDHQRQGYMDLGFTRFIDKPVRAEAIYQCLAEDLGIAFDYAEDKLAAAQTADKGDWHAVELPSALCEGLVLAVRSHSVTELQKRLDEMAELGPEGESLATQLRAKAQRYDMVGIRAMLQEVGVEVG